MVWQDKTKDGLKMLSSWNKTSRVSSAMCFWHPNSYLTLVPFQPSWELNSGETTGCRISKIKPSQWPKTLIHWKSCQLKPLKPNGKTKAFHRTQCHSKMHPSFPHAHDGHYWSIHNCKVQTGSEVLKETTCHPSTSIKNTGWENSPRTFQKVEPCSLKVSKKKLKPPWTHFCLVLSSRKVSATLCNLVVKSLTTIQSSSCSWWQNCQILTSDQKSLPNVQ